MTMEVPANFTQLLSDWRSGHPHALERLTPLVYDELRRLARSYMRTERGSHTLQATAVVHEAFLRLVQANVDLQDRQHFFSLRIAAHAPGAGGPCEVALAGQTRRRGPRSQRGRPLGNSAAHRRRRGRSGRS